MNIHFKNLSFKYGKKTILKGISGTIHPGITAVVGPNAAGKTTLLKCMANILKAKGDVLIDGNLIQTINREDLFKTLSFLPQKMDIIPHISVLEYVLLGRLHDLTWRVKEKDLKCAASILHRLGIDHLAAITFSNLSGGQQKLVSIAQALVNQPAILIMDEPTNSLDLNHAIKIFNLIQEIADDKEMIVILSIHDLNAAIRYAKTIIILKNGEIYARGAPESVITSKAIASVYNVRADIYKENDALFVHPIDAL